MFDKLSHWTMTDWKNSDAYRIININFENNNWISDEKIQPQEGKLEILKYKDAWKRMWEKISTSDKKIIMNLPNFDNKVFKKITGIEI